jgi:hypothetical protein
MLDPADPITYQTTVHWPPPLPTDVLVKLNEEMMKMQMGLQSKRGACCANWARRSPTRRWPRSSRTHGGHGGPGRARPEACAIQRVIMEVTGMGDTMLMLQDIMADSNRDLMAEIVQKATVAKQPQRRNESTNSNNE